MKKPIFVSALLGWATAAVLMVVIAFVMDGSSSVADLWVPILLYVFWTGIFAVPACSIAGGLVNQFLPVSSANWKPERATLIGGVCGFLAMWVVLVLTSGELNIFQSYGWIPCVIAAPSGAVCGFSLARFKHKLLKLDASTPHP